ncbi:hypothetical protein PIB30_069688 [Stylosanthes scabra]|uniref:Putative plant transposon protein domain-containing protein n=1 Tax=Stylosanthes scabra TaxID=79078 RepID=A0ABU6YLE8_9FABA|nr:hypothetical protein [Stylosanthes scabra]
MASSSKKRRAGKQVMTEEEFDAQRFNLEEGEFSEIEQQIELRGWKRLAKPKLKVRQSIIREFYANAHINEDSDEDQPHFHTFVRGEVVNFSMESIKAVLRLDEQLESDTNFRRRMIPANQELENVIQDLCVRGSTWELGARNNPLYLKRRDLCPLARGWHGFIIHNILPTSNQSEVTVKRAVLIHCIIHGQDVRVKKLIAEAITEIVKDLHTTRHPLAFPNVIAHQCEAAGISYRAPNSKEAVPKIRPITAAVMENIRYPHNQPPPPPPPPQPQQYVGEGEHQEQPAYDAQMPQGYGWEQLQADMANLRTTQAEFYESILAQNSSYGLHLREIEVKQNDMWAEQIQFYKDMNPSLAPVPPTSITTLIQNNVQDDKPMFDGMLGPWPVGEPSIGDKGKASVDKDALRDPNESGEKKQRELGSLKKKKNGSKELTLDST